VGLRGDGAQEAAHGVVGRDQEEAPDGGARVVVDGAGAGGWVCACGGVEVQFSSALRYRGPCQWPMCILGGPAAGHNP
jgi:hypothetical protein